MRDSIDVDSGVNQNHVADANSRIIIASEFKIVACVDVVLSGIDKDLPRFSVLVDIFASEASSDKGIVFSI